MTEAQPSSMPGSLFPFRRRAMRFVPALSALLALGGCISFGSEPPPTLLTLEGESAPAAGAERSGEATSALVVARPSIAKKLDTARVPVQVDANNVAYLTDTAWVERPDRLLQQLLSQTIEAGGNRLVLAPDIAAGRQAVTLQGELIEFGIDRRAMEVVLIYDAILTGNGGSLRKRRFEAREPIGKVEARPAGVALNAAANRVAREVAAWVD